MENTVEHAFVKPAISVIIPACNAAATLPRALDLQDAPQHDRNTATHYLNTHISYTRDICKHIAMGYVP